MSLSVCQTVQNHFADVLRTVCRQRMLLASVALTTRRRVLFVKISQQQLTATRRRVDAIINHTVDAVLILCHPLLIHLWSQRKLLPIDALKQIGHRVNVLAGNVVNDSFCIESFERVIDFIFSKFALFRQQSLFDENIVRKQARVVAQ